MDLNHLPDLSTISDVQAEQLCQQLRMRILEVVSHNGGHLASNLGVVEISVALHRVFHTQRDRIVFDVGHQCYTHKILTGRNEAMESLRQFQGLSGYPKPLESQHDAFIAGHASNSVSVALGMARSRTQAMEDYNIIALFGDGALTGGLAYEGLANAGQSGEPLLVILNDNGMSITENVGGMAEYLAQQRLKPQYLRFKKGYRRVLFAIPGGRQVYRFTHKVKKAVKETLLPSSFFENMGFVYMGPVDGHNVKELTALMRYAKDLACPVLLHVRTVKGKGYTPAVENPDAFHGIGSFQIDTGLGEQTHKTTFSSVFGEALTQLAEQDNRICAVTAAMRDGTGLGAFAKRYPQRFFDVGIAEGHATAMAAGMASQGSLPVFAVYASFLQRSYDMLIHDVSIQHLHVIFAVDRAGLVGEDGETHHGLFDVAFLSTVPGMTVYAPASFAEVHTQLKQAIYEATGPVAIRYPRGGELSYAGDAGTQPTVTLKEGKGITLVTYGTLTGTILEVADRLEQVRYSAQVIKLNRILPLDMGPILDSVRETGRLLVAEEVISMGCVGREIAASLALQGVQVKCILLKNAGDTFLPHGSVSQLRTLCGLDVQQLYQTTLEVLAHEC